MDLVSASHGTIAPHVLQITLPFDGGRLLIPDGVFMRVGALYALQSAIFKGIYRFPTYNIQQIQDTVTVLGSLPKLACLELSNLKLNSFLQLRDVIVACPGLKRLYMDTVTQHHEGSEPPNVEPLALPCPPLLLLKITGCDFNEEFFEWLVACQSSLRLKSLCIGFPVVLEHELALGRLLRVLGPSLQKLSFHRVGMHHHDKCEFLIKQ